MNEEELFERELREIDEMDPVWPEGKKLLGAMRSVARDASFDGLEMARSKFGGVAVRDALRLTGLIRRGRAVAQ